MPLHEEAPAAAAGDRTPVTAGARFRQPLRRRSTDDEAVDALLELEHNGNSENCGASGNAGILRDTDVLLSLSSSSSSSSSSYSRSTTTSRNNTNAGRWDTAALSPGSPHTASPLGCLPAQLPSFAQVETRRSDYVGPTDESNWVLPGRLLVGAYPAEVDDCAHVRVLSAILGCGVSTFVCLQSEYDHFSRNVAAWRSGSAIRPYVHDALRLLRENAASTRPHPGMVAPERLGFLYLSIDDCDVTGDGEVVRLARALCWRLLRGEVVYLHCWGGHGRTGTLVSLVLGLLYKVSRAEALKRTQLYHDLRACPLHVPSPQTFAQRMQVLRILESCGAETSVAQLWAQGASADLGLEFALPIDGQHASVAALPHEAQPAPQPLEPETAELADALPAGTPRDEPDCAQQRENRGLQGRLSHEHGVPSTRKRRGPAETEAAHPAPKRSLQPPCPPCHPSPHGQPQQEPLPHSSPEPGPRLLEPPCVGASEVLCNDAKAGCAHL